MKLIRRFIGAMLAVSLGLGVQVFGPTLLPYLATNAVAAEVLPGLVPALSLAGYSGDDGFVVTVSNYDPTFTWDIWPSQGSLSFGLPRAAGVMSITVRNLPASGSALLTVTASREGYADGTASIIGYSRTPVAAIPAPTATASPTPTPSPTPPPMPTSAPVPTETPSPTPTQTPTPVPIPVSPPAPPTTDPAAELALAEQRAKDMQQALADDELKTNADVIALTQRITEAITKRIRAEDRRIIANAKALARHAAKSVPKPKSKKTRPSLLTPEVRRALRR